MNAVNYQYGTYPTQVTDLELDKGLLHLVNRGLLPGKVDLTPALCGEAGEGGRGRRQGGRDAGGPVREGSGGRLRLKGKVLAVPYAPWGAG